MATKTQELLVVLRGDISGLQAQLAFANQNISNFRKKTESELGLVGGAFRKAATAALTIGAAWGAFRVGSSIVQAGVQMQALTAKMGAATGSSQIAGEALAFVRAEAQRLGLDFRSSADGFASFSASALRAGLSFDEVKTIFTGVSEAATGMRLSTERTQLVFMALSQMASKGTVSMEELKQQLGESLPGALQVFSKAMGVSNAAFIKMIGNGEVTTRDLIKLGDGLRKEFGGAAVQASQGAQAAFNRFGNSFFELQLKMANTGFLDAITDAAKRLTDQMNDPSTQEGLTVFAKLLGDIASAAVTAASAVGKVYAAIDKGVDSIGDSIFSSLFGQAGTDALDKARRQRESRRRTGNALTDNASTSSYTPNAELEALLAQGAGGSSGSYSLGGGGAPGETAAQRIARERIARQREQLRNRVGNIREANARETDPGKAAILEWQEQQKELEKALQKQAITKEEFRQAELEAEVALQEKLTEARKRANDIEVDMRGKALDNIMGFLNVFAGKNKAIAMAMIAFDKARLIAQAIMETHVAAVAALKYDPTGATSARVTAYGYANVAAIAATGIAQLATMGGGGSSGGSSGGYSTGDGGSVTSSSAATKRGGTYFIDLGKKTIFSQNDLRNLLEQMQETLGDGTQLVVSR